MRSGAAFALVPTLWIVAACSQQAPGLAPRWNPAAAAAYLDRRQAEWAEWPAAQRDQDTFCVSCHTGLPYLIARPALRSVLGETRPSAGETDLLDNVRKRVRFWRDAAPFYSGDGADPKSAESRGTESVLNALILASADTESGRLSEDTRMAFADMWAEQRTTGSRKGAWLWLNFDLEPWEAAGSAYHGAALAALGVGLAPGGYSSDPGIQANVELLREYLREESPSQSTLNHAALLWASTRLPGILNDAERAPLIEELLAMQSEDGGWSLPSLTFGNATGWKRLSVPRRWFRWDGIPIRQSSDGYATGFVTFVLLQAGVGRDHPQLQRGLSWLSANQGEAEGNWTGYSLNKDRDPSSEVGHFMSDAATAYAVLALTDDARIEGANRRR